MTATTARPTGHPGYSETLPRTPGSAATARRLVRVAFATWRLEELAEDGALIVSELVTNAVQHARSGCVRVRVTRLCATSVQLAVVDRSRVLPVRRDAGADDLDGRGLALVEAMAACWGTDLLPWGKRVWARLETWPEVRPECGAPP